jgi:hypothetical protein
MIHRLESFPVTEGVSVQFNLYLGYFPGKANITVVAESKQSSTCPNEATEEQTLNWKDTVVKDLLVEVCTSKTVSSSSRSRQCLKGKIQRHCS